MCATKKVKSAVCFETLQSKVLASESLKALNTAVQKSYLEAMLQIKRS